MNEIIEDFCHAWQELDAELIIKHLDESFVYDSQWVFESLDCEEYKVYIKGKFQTLKNNGESLHVEIVEDPHLGGKMLKMAQGNNAPCYYRIIVKDGKVVKGDLCMF